jgi:intein/homing endonuclease
LIKTTGEHPFYVESRGWLPAKELSVGDMLATLDGQFVPVTSVRATEEFVQVYNFRIADHHTYFVGDENWRFDVWAHNANCVKIVEHDDETVVRIRNKFEEGSYESNQLKRFVGAWNEEIDAAGGSMTRRRPTPIEEIKSQAWREEMRASDPSRFEGKVVGHTPDAAAGGPSSGGRAMALSYDVNSYLGGILRGIPVGTTYNRVSLSRTM